MKRFVLVTGGTGGHVFPAKSLADEFERHGHEVIFLTDKRGALYSKHFSKTHTLNFSNQSSKIKLFFCLIIQTFICIKWLRLWKPEAVIGFGCYASVPGILAAQLLRIKTIIHEQNTIIGKANKYLSWGARSIACSFDKPLDIKKKAILTGNPTRPSLLLVPPYTIPETEFRILVLGGSAGARIFSLVVPQALCRLPEKMQKRIVVMQQSREELIDETSKLYKNFKGQVQIEKFFEDIGSFYAKAHLVVGRSGASTISELCVVGRPSLLIPFSSRAENDQWQNATFMKHKKAALMISEYHFTPLSLSKILYDLIKAPEVLLELSANAKLLSIPNASSKLADLVYKS